MNKFFHCTDKAASSARIEAYFKDWVHTHGLKHSTNPNKFIPQHKKVLSSQVKYAMSEIIKEELLQQVCKA